MDDGSLPKNASFMVDWVMPLAIFDFGGLDKVHRFVGKIQRSRTSLQIVHGGFMEGVE